MGLMAGPDIGRQICETVTLSSDLWGVSTTVSLGFSRMCLFIQRYPSCFEKVAVGSAAVTGSLHWRPESIFYSENSLK